MVRCSQGPTVDVNIESIAIQRNLSITDTLGPEKQFVIERFPLLRGYFMCTAICLDPRKPSVIERFSLLGEFVI